MMKNEAELREISKELMRQELAMSQWITIIQTEMHKLGILRNKIHELINQGEQNDRP